MSWSKADAKLIRTKHPQEHYAHIRSSSMIIGIGVYARMILWIVRFDFVSSGLGALLCELS